MKNIITLNSQKLIEVKAPILVSNILELKEIEGYKEKHPNLSMNEAAIQWIDHSAASWRANYLTGS